MFRIRVVSTPANLERLQARGPAIIEALTQRMNLLMFKLQSKIVGEEIPKYFPKGAPNIASEVRTIPATVSGTKILGQVEGGGPRTTRETLGGPNAGRPVDYAAVQEAGVGHAWKIQPVLYSSAWAVSQKSRVLSVAGLPRALKFILNGKTVIVRSVTHPILAARPYMRQGLADSETAIIAGLQEEINAQLNA